MGNYITKDGKTKSPIYTCQGTGVNKKCKMTPKWDKLWHEEEGIKILTLGRAGFWGGRRRRSRKKRNHRTRRRRRRKRRSRRRRR